MGRRGRSVFGNSGNTFFITTTVVNFQNIFSYGDAYNNILLNSLKHLINEHKALLIAFVFMPSHIHLIINMPEGESISDLMRDFKKYTSTKIRQQLENDGSIKAVEMLRKNAAGKKQVFKLWKDRFDDLVITSVKTLRLKIEYIHDNPVRAGLVESAVDWKYSSAKNYLLGDHSLIYVVTDFC